MSKSIEECGLSSVVDNQVPLPAKLAQGNEAVRFNSMKHGILSRYTVLSHEKPCGLRKPGQFVDG